MHNSYPNLTASRKSGYLLVRHKDKKAGEGRSAFKLHATVPVFKLNFQQVNNHISNLYTLLIPYVDSGKIHSFKVFEDKYPIRYSKDYIGQHSDNQKAFKNENARELHNIVTIYPCDDKDFTHLQPLINQIEQVLSNVAVEDRYLTEIDIKLSQHISMRRDLDKNGKYISVDKLNDNEKNKLIRSSKQSTFYKQLNIADSVVENNNDQNPVSTSNQDPLILDNYFNNNSKLPQSKFLKTPSRASDNSHKKIVKSINQKNQLLKSSVTNKDSNNSLSGGFLGRKSKQIQKQVNKKIKDKSIVKKGCFGPVRSNVPHTNLDLRPT